jgi:hypothetical protein
VRAEVAAMKHIPKLEEVPAGTFGDYKLDFPQQTIELKDVTFCKR